MNLNQDTLRQSRIDIIFQLYQFELYEQKIESDSTFENSDLNKKEIANIEWIANKYDALKNIISKCLAKGWDWDRIAPLERAILLYGTFELAFQKKAIVINELVEITKEYTTESHYKYINSILDKIGSFYEQYKAS